MKTRTKAGITLIALVLLGIAGWSIYGWWLKHKLERYKSELVTKGEKLTVAEFIADHRVPEFNSAEVFNRSTAFCQKDGILSSNPPVAMRMVAPGRAMVGWRQPHLIDKTDKELLPYSDLPITNTWDELAEELAAARGRIELLHQITAHPDLDFHLNYNAGYQLLLPHLSPFKGSAQLLSAAALLDLHNGNSASASKHIRAILALSKGLRNEPIVISQLVRIAVMNLAIAPTWELLQSPDASEADLKLIQSDFAGQDFIVPMTQALEMERTMISSHIGRFREQGGVYEAFQTSGGGPATTTLMERVERSFSPREIRKSSNELLWQSALSYEDEMISLQGITALIEALRSAATNKPLAEVCSNAFLRVKLDVKVDEEGFFGALLDREDKTSLGSLREMFSNTGAKLWGTLRRVQTTEQCRALVVSAIALKRHQLRSGNLPQTLDALVPEFLAAPPRDPVDGKLLRYQSMPDGRFLLYSVGENAVDDGGDASSAATNSNSHPNMQRGRDLVWPQPATPEEMPAQVERKLDGVVEEGIAR